MGPKSRSGWVGSGWLSQTSPIPRSPDGDNNSQEKVPAFQASPDGGKVVPVSTPIGGAQLKETEIKTARRERIQLGSQEGLEQGEQQRASEAAAP